jgi:glycosyltransferase involved in cell wall biosynthesis
MINAMNIAIFTNNYLPNPYGVSSSIESFRKEFEKMGHTVYIFAPYAKGFIDENPCVYRYPAIDFHYKISFPLAIPYSYKISRILKDLSIDIIHSHHPNLLGWEARRWAKKKKVPLVFTWHTLYDRYAHFIPILPVKLSANLAIRSAVRYANSCDQVIIPTKSVKKIIVNWGVTKSVSVVSTGITEEFLDNSHRDESRKMFGIKEDEIVLLSLSRLTPEKNLDFLIHSVIKILAKYKKGRFILAGEGGELEKIKMVIGEAGITDRVIFTGMVNGQMKKNVYAAADIFVYASTSETQGMILVEAMAVGLPIVAVAATGSSDMVGNYVTGILTKENEEVFVEAVMRLVKDEKMLKLLGENAKRVFNANYTGSICADKMLKIYQKLLMQNQEKESNCN